MPDLAFIAKRGERCQAFGHAGHSLRLSGRVEAPDSAKMIVTSVGDVELVQIDVVGPQPAQRIFNRGPQCFGGDLRAAAHDVLAKTRHLGGDYHFVTAASRRDPASNETFGSTDRVFANRVDGIDLRGVDEIHATLDRTIKLRVRLGLGVLATPGH